MAGLGHEAVPMRVLVVEDDAGISHLLAEKLREEGFYTATVSSGREMDSYLKGANPDIILLDVMLPGESGISICRRLRDRSDIPIIMLTALGEEADRVTGLEIGADDYVTKPFRSRELVARIRALMRRANAHRTRTESLSPVAAYRFAGWRLEPFSRQLMNPDGARVMLTSAEFDLLLAFCCKPGCVLSREQLLDLTHGGSAGPIERSIDVHVSRVRQKIDPGSADVSFIKTVRLGGYIFTPIVELL